MGSRNGANRKSLQQKYRELQQAHRRLRAELAKAEEKHQAYRELFHDVALKRFSFTKKELERMKENPISTADLLKDRILSLGVIRSSS